MRGNLPAAQIPSDTDVKWATAITFALNGRRVHLRAPSPQMKLIEYLREVARLPGTKLSCGEGGCGACTVVLCHRPLAPPFPWVPRDETAVFRAVNACLFPVCALDGLEVITVEHVGSTRGGLHAVQSRLVAANGTQCGFCTPGWIMNMYELLRQHQHPGGDTGDAVTGIAPTRQAIEDQFDGNLCRCTGYRPILEAFHSFAQDAGVVDGDPVQTTSSGPINTITKTALDIEDDRRGDDDSGAHGCGGARLAYEARDDLEGSEEDDWQLVTVDTQSLSSPSAGIVRKSCSSLWSSSGACLGTCGGSKHCSQRQQQQEHYLDLEELIAPPNFSLESDTTKLTEIEPAAFILNFVPQPLRLEDVLTQRKWYRPLTMAHLGAVLRENCVADIRLVGGRTAHGVSKYYNQTAPYNAPDEGAVQVEVNYIPELKKVHVDTEGQWIEVGAAVTLHMLLTLLHTYRPRDDVGKHDQSVAILHELAALLKRVANHQVRTTATWAGNLALCREHPSFVSDVVVALMGVEATLTLVNDQLEREEGVSIEDFVHRPLSDFAMIVSMRLPLDHPAKMISQVEDTKMIHRLSCYKVAQRPQNSHSHVNCAIYLAVRIDDDTEGVVVSRVCVTARIVFGGVCQYPARFPLTEAFLTGAALTHASVTEAMTHLERDLAAIGASDAFGSQQFRVSTMKSLLYKSILSVIGEDALVDQSVASAAARLQRGISSGTQSFKPNGGTTPVSQAIPKIGAKLQATGEARYVADNELPSSALFGAILYSRTALGKLRSIDKDGAMREMDGVVDLVTAQDIPGANDVSSGTKEEPLFVNIGGIVRCVGSPLGMVVATHPEIAERAAAACVVEYDAVPDDQLWPGQAADSPILNLEMARTAGTLVAGQERIAMGDDDVEQKLEKCPYQLKGEIMLGAQKHFYMEPQSSVASLQEGGVILVESSSQFPAFVQQQLSSVLAVAQNQVTVRVQRVGGGFGGKLTRCVINAGAAAVAALKHERTIRVVNDRSADFRLVGGRENMRGTYRVGFDKDGYIHAMDLQLDVDCGFIVSDSADSATMAVQWSDSAYRIPSFRCQAFLYLTNTQNCTSLRAPGVPQSLMLVEAALHHVAETLNLPMRWVQERNLYHEGDRTPYGQLLSDVQLTEVWDRLLVSSSLDQREEAIALFNSNNKWKKRGIAITPTKYGMLYSTRRDGSRVDVFAGDGSVSITHGGCEIGQGIHTKVAQVCAYELGIPMELISVKATSTDQVPNSESTGGSSTSESMARSVMVCCQEIKKLMKPIVDQHHGKSWPELVQLTNAAGIRLFACAQPFSILPNPSFSDYFVYAAACSEVEVDILTGEINILSSELVYDCGVSLNPAVDIGQIEGGFVMGIGLYMEEDVIYGVPDGALLSQGTWEYKVPCAKDIPEKFKVTLLENARNKTGILNSKATGEPPYALATSVYFAVKKALLESRSERGVTAFFQMDVPATVARRQDAASIQAQDYTC